VIWAVSGIAHVNPRLLVTFSPCILLLVTHRAKDNPKLVFLQQQWSLLLQQLLQQVRLRQLVACINANYCEVFCEHYDECF
jgi:hypothetical protein